ncbi:hypothetical protein [Paenibacillus sp. MBLB4367]|uniref:hypothetical protein n=1 Tax=Paenibacillus sp. MBLB4367 TaxID=3384767 RepID=UPI00390811E8
MLTFFVVQYTKGLMDQFAHWLPTDVYAVVVAFLVLIMAQLAIGANATDWRMYGLAFANAFLIAAAAGQMQNKAVRPPGHREGDGDGKGI